MIIPDDDIRENDLIKSAVEATKLTTITGKIIEQKKTIIKEETKEQDKSKQDDITPQQ